VTFEERVGKIVPTVRMAVESAQRPGVMQKGREKKEKQQENMRG